MKPEILARHQAEAQKRNADKSIPNSGIEMSEPTAKPASDGIRPSWLPEKFPVVVGHRPDAWVIVLRHTRGADKCTFTRKENDERCKCPRWMSVKGEGRIPLGTGDKIEAEIRVKQYQDCRDETKQEELQLKRRMRADYGYTPMKIDAGFDTIIGTVDEGSVDVIGKLNTMKKQLLAFLAPQRVEFFHQLTFELLEHQWRKVWTADTYNTETTFLSNLVFVLHTAQSYGWMVDERKPGAEGCECIACRMEPASGAAEVQSKVPFNQRRKLHGGDSDWQFKVIVRSCLARFGAVSKRRPNQARRLATFMHVMRYTGARISDVALMARNAVNLETGLWQFLPLKTQRTCKKPRWVRTYLPPHVRELLRTLPEGVNADPAYFFLPKREADAKPQTAANPWTNDFAALWPLVDAEAEFEHFADGDKQVIGIKDWITGKMVAVGSHFFRNTYVVNCRLQKPPMDWDRIGLLIGDDGKTVKDHYGPYTVDEQESIADDLARMFPAENPETALFLPDGAIPASGRASLV